MVAPLVGAGGAAGCAGIHHPPSYAQIAAFDPRRDEDPEEMARRANEIRTALAFTPSDLDELAASGDTALLVGGVAQTDWQDRRGDELLAAAEGLTPSASLVLLAWIDRQLVAGFEAEPDAARDAELRQRLRLLHESMPDNALPFYVSAYGKLRGGDTAAALAAMQVGRERPHFDSGSRERFTAIVNAAEAVGYSPFTARYHAMSRFVPTGTYSALRRLCSELVAGPEVNKGRIECVLLGHSIETSSWNMLERVVGLSLQAIAWENVNAAEGDAARAAINSRWQELKNADHLPSLRDLSEAAWLEYFRIFVDSGEDAAMRYATAAASPG